MSIRVLFADDSALMRREIARIVNDADGIELVGVARNGQEAVEMTRELDPNVVLLDINMPVLDGLSALQVIMMEMPRPVVMLSSLTQDGAETTYESLDLGAVDFIAKPGGTVSKNIGQVAVEIVEKIQTAARATTDSIRGMRSRRLKRQQRRGTSKQRITRGTLATPDQIVVIGQSTGGPNTIMDIIPLLPEDLGAPLVIVQHMPASFTPSFAQRLNNHCAFPVKEAKAGDILQVNHGYLAPGNIHLTLKKLTLESGVKVVLTQSPRNSLYKPSVNVTMRSALKLYGSNVVAALLTGMGDDGADAMVEIRQAGGRAIAESEETAIVFGMPKEAIARGGAEFVLPSYDIGDKIVELTQELR